MPPCCGQARYCGDTVVVCVRIGNHDSRKCGTGWQAILGVTPTNTRITFKQSIVVFSIVYSEGVAQDSVFTECWKQVHAGVLEPRVLTCY